MNKELKLSVGKKFGKWEIISETTERKNNITHWKCRCECGVISRVPLNNLMNGSSTQCHKCALKESGKKRRKGHGEISGQMWSHIKKNAEKKTIFFDLRIEEAWDLYESQKGKCYLTGMDITLTGYPYNKKKTTATLVLINPEFGYYGDNIVWVHKKVGKMLSDMSIDEFYNIITKVINRFN